ncbi:MAG: phosphotransferase [Propioniciclava sp.]|uniref:phosphotransferase n=1 Tax=Propioniciclava sp. TaxID=2038686 RepID=UPI0039E530AC
MNEELDGAWMRHLESVRWFGGKGAGAHIVRRDALPAHTAEGAWPRVRSEIATLAYPDGHQEYYHLLVAHRPSDVPAGAVVLGTSTDADGAPVQVIDATTDAEALTAFVAATMPAFAGRPVGVWSGEQSNTTLTLGEGDLYKVFRRIEPGPNLETEVLMALAGGPVPQVRGRLVGDWPAGTGTDLGIVMERIPGAVDGWELATAACRAGEDFSPRAQALGEALRRTHTRLAEAFGVREASGDAIAELMSARLDAAVAAAPGLAEHAAPLRAAFDGVRGRTLAVQRVHGDFHLGQTLDSPAGWTLIDFEGEPAKTAAERRAFDSPWRDVAGMVRSFDYARSAHDDPASAEAIGWADLSREAFVAGYCGPHTPDDVLRAYMIDKAVYEVVYEVRNRPDWVSIPMRAIHEAAGTPTSSHTDKE